MKICQCCAAVSAPDAPHCLNCGEASWSVPLTVAGIVEIADTLDSADAPAEDDATPMADIPLPPTQPSLSGRKRGPR